MKLREFFEVAAFCTSVALVPSGLAIAAAGVNNISLTPEVVACLDASVQGKPCTAFQEIATIDYERAPQKAVYGGLFAAGCALTAYSLKRRLG